MRGPHLLEVAVVVALDWLALGELVLVLSLLVYTTCYQQKQGKLENEKMDRNLLISIALDPTIRQV